ncbi:MAG TPA: hypothetical protein VMX57_08230 [Planctomycetota bacterium]|nr:hypothetical protein [Planctomycetota bacterium]
MTKRPAWVEERGQRVWLWIAVVFGVFYLGESLLFLGPEPRVPVPVWVFPIYWGAFGAAVIGLVLRGVKGHAGRATSGFPRRVRFAILGVGITTSVVGMSYLVMGVARDVTLGHVVLLGTMFEAGIIIGGISGNLGWLSAGVVWGTGGILVLCCPSIQDFTIGVVVFVGFALLGLIRRRVCEPVPTGTA